LALAGACTPADKAVQEAQAPSNVQVLAKGGPFRGVNGMMFGPDGRLYVTSVVTPALAALDPESGAIVEQWGPAEGVKGPDDLAFGPDGSVYWTDIFFGEVGKRTPGGTSSVVASIGPGVNPITFSDDGRLFVSQCFLGDELFEVDPAGAQKPRLISDQLGPGCGLNGMDWGPDDKLYGPRWFRGEIARVDVDTGAVETVASGFQVPAAVKFDSQNRLHVLDTLAGEIVRLDLAGGGREVVGRVGPGGDNLAFDAGDRLFVSSYADGFVLEVTGPNSTREVSAGGVNMPGGIAWAAAQDGRSGRLFLADVFALRELDPATGAEIHAVRDVIGFSPQGSVMSAQWSNGQLVLTSWFDNLVRLWNPDDDTLVARFEGFGRPIDATIYAGDVVVSEYDSGSAASSPTASRSRRGSPRPPRRCTSPTASPGRSSRCWRAESRSNRPAWWRAVSPAPRGWRQARTARLFLSSRRTPRASARSTRRVEKRRPSPMGSRYTCRVRGSFPPA
jgi:sugar lactone lactonase YvrE